MRIILIIGLLGLADISWIVASQTCNSVTSTNEQCLSAGSTNLSCHHFGYDYVLHVVSSAIYRRLSASPCELLLSDTAACLVEQSNTMAAVSGACNGRTDCQYSAAAPSRLPGNCADYRGPFVLRTTYNCLPGPGTSVSSTGMCQGLTVTGQSVEVTSFSTSASCYCLLTVPKNAEVAVVTKTFSADSAAAANSSLAACSQTVEADGLQLCVKVAQSTLNCHPTQRQYNVTADTPNGSSFDFRFEMQFTAPPGQPLTLICFNETSVQREPCAFVQEISRLCLADYPQNISCPPNFLLSVFNSAVYKAVDYASCAALNGLLDITSLADYVAELTSQAACFTKTTVDSAAAACNGFEKCSIASPIVDSSALDAHCPGYNGPYFANTIYSCVPATPALSSVNICDGAADGNVLNVTSASSPSSSDAGPLMINATTCSCTLAVPASTAIQLNLVTFTTDPHLWLYSSSCPFGVHVTGSNFTGTLCAQSSVIILDCLPERMVYTISYLSSTSYKAAFSLMIAAAAPRNISITCGDVTSTTTSISLITPSTLRIAPTSLRPIASTSVASSLLAEKAGTTTLNDLAPLLYGGLKTSGKNADTSNPGLIAGVVIGCFLLLAIIILGALLICRCKQRKAACEEKSVPADNRRFSQKQSTYDSPPMTGQASETFTTLVYTDGDRLSHLVIPSIGSLSRRTKRPSDEEDDGASVRTGTDSGLGLIDVI